MKSVELTVFLLSALKRARVKKLRGASRVPAVIYGRERESSRHLEIELKALEDLIHHSASENLLVDLEVEGKDPEKHLALVQEIQHHPVSGGILHVDFHEVAPNEKVTVTVTVETTGEAIGVKAGGVLEHLLFRVKLRGLPKDLPDDVTVDVTNLEVGEAIHIGDIETPEGVEILGDKQISVIAVAAPRVEEEPTEVAEEGEEASAEPEVIKEKKDEEGEGSTDEGK